MQKLKKIFTDWRVIFALCFLALMLFILWPNPLATGVAITGVIKDSAAAEAGFENPSSDIKPMNRERILSINDAPITNEKDYYTAIQKISANDSVIMRTTRTTRILQARESFKKIELNETEEQVITVIRQVNDTIDGTLIQTNTTVNQTIQVPKSIQEFAGVADLGLRVGPAPTSNLKKGLDLQGGTRVLVRPAEPVSNDVFSAMVDNLKERLNVYGLSDIVVTEVTQPAILGGSQNKFILVEIAGAAEEEVKSLIGKQGKFEASISNTTVFKGGADIRNVCRIAECSGLDPRRACAPTGDGSYGCGFQFSITLSPQAAAKQAQVTKGLRIQGTGQETYLSEPLILYLDDQQVDTLSISADLRGKAVTEISISGSGTGSTLKEAQSAALTNMRKLQTVLMTGSLPVRIEIAKSDTISSVLGSQFLNNSIFVAIIAGLCVSIILLAVYRKIILAAPIILTMLAEVLSILGLAALIGQSIDLAAVAGIIMTIGSGVNDQILMLDETLRHKQQYINWKESLKRAFFIILSSFATIFVAMIPLLFAGAGLLKGFAIATMLGASVGAFITRPAYAAILQALSED